MALTAAKTFIAGEVLTASDLNAMNTNILNNALALISPLTGTLDCDGNQLTLDGDADLNLVPTSDDVLALRIGSTSLIVWNLATASAVNGVTITASAAAGAVKIETTGSDTDIPLNLVTKGTGALQWDGTAFGTVFSRDTGTGTTNVPLVSDIHGKESIAIPASGMFPQTTNPCSQLTQVELTANQPELLVLDFSGTSVEIAQFSIPLPKSWNAGTLNYRVFWTSSATDTDGVVWRLSPLSRVDGDAIASAFSDLQDVTDNAQSAANDLYVSSYSSNLTVTSAAADALTWFRVDRRTSEAADTMAEDARLLYVFIQYTTSALNDS